MNYPITCDQRGCGQGKTTGTIYKQINQNLLNHINTLLVVPSILLQEQYKQQWPQACVINSELDQLSTQKQLLAHTQNNQPLICITHATFCMISATSGFKSRYSLIIDEAIAGIIDHVQCDIVDDKKWQYNMQFAQLFKLVGYLAAATVQADPTNQTDYYQLDLAIANPLDFSFSDSPTYKRLCDPNRIIYVTAACWSNLTNSTSSRNYFMRELHPAIMQGWHDVLIAAANFSRTPMWAWLKHHKFPITTLPGCEFQEHWACIKFYSEQYLGTTTLDPVAKTPRRQQWSGRLRREATAILSNWHAHINRIVEGAPVLTLRNNDEQASRAGAIANEQVLGHSMFGLHKYQHYLNVNCESSLNLVPEVKRFIQWRWRSDLRTIAHYTHAYLFYQMLMRTAARSRDYQQQQINFFCLDQEITAAVMEYFDTTNCDVELLDCSVPAPLPPGRPRVLTPEQVKKNKQERDKKSYEKKKNAT